MKFSTKLTLCFLSGATIYPIIELIYRGYTHFSMAILGGVCLCAVFSVHTALGRGKILTKALLSTVLITQCEFLCGVIVNILLGLSVWDYSDRKFHVLAQVCPRFSFYWFLLSVSALMIFSLLSNKSRKSAAT